MASPPFRFDQNSRRFQGFRVRQLATTRGARPAGSSRRRLWRRPRQPGPEATRRGQPRTDISPLKIPVVSSLGAPGTRARAAGFGSVSSGSESATVPSPAEEPEDRPPSPSRSDDSEATRAATRHALPPIDGPFHAPPSLSATRTRALALYAPGRAKRCARHDPATRGTLGGRFNRRRSRSPEAGECVCLYLPFPGGRMLTH